MKKKLLLIVLTCILFAGLNAQDVRVAYRELPSSAKAGSTIAIETNVINAGTQPSAAFTMYYYINDVGSLNGNEQPLYQYNNGTPSHYTDGIRAMSPDGEDDVRHRPTIPSDLRTGTYYIIWYLDINDENTSNNISSRSISITGLPDLKVASGSAPFTAGSGESISVSCTIKNIGEASAGSSTLKYYISSNTSLGSGDEQLGTDAVSSLGINSSSNESASLTIPIDRSGSQYILFVADATNNVDEANEGNNILAKAINIESPSVPDLEVASGSVPSTASSGESISVSCTIKNIGEASAGSSILNYYISSNNSLGSGDEQLGTDAVSSLGINSTSNESASLTIPSDRSGPQYILFVADATNNVDEADETNNTFAMTLNIEETKPDLYTSSEGFNPSFLYLNNTTLTWSANLVNQGNADINSYTEVNAYLSRDNTFSSSDFLVGTRFVNSIDANQEKLLLGNGDKVIYDYELSEGDYYLIIVTDPYDDIDESNENNNERVVGSITLEKSQGGIICCKPWPRPKLLTQEVNNNKITAYPNPTEGAVELNVGASDNESYVLIISDSYDNIIYKTTVHGKFDSKIDLSSENAGLFIIRKITKNKSETIKIYKK